MMMRVVRLSLKFLMFQLLLFAGYRCHWGLAFGVSRRSPTSCITLATKQQNPGVFLLRSSQAVVQKRRIQQRHYASLTTGRTRVGVSAAVQDLDVVGLVAGQENYGLAIVCAGEAIYSFLEAPSTSNIKVLVPGLVAAVVLVLVSGPMITSGDAASAGTGLGIATAVSIGLGMSYVLRLLARYSETPKEIAALGLLVSIAGFFSFSQNLLVDGFVSLPSVSLPSLPSLELPDLSDLVGGGGQQDSMPSLPPMTPEAPAEVGQDVPSLTEVIPSVDLDAGAD